jgi:tetratricopeptide (TPR) repeat protein
MMEDRVRFLMESLQLIEQTQGNAERVYAFWQMNIDEIDTPLIQIMPDLASQLFELKGKEERELIARLFGIFGYLMGSFPLGNQRINLELAITCFQICASIFTRNEYSRMWAMTQDSLGNAYRERIEGERKQNIERAIQAYQASLEVCTREAFPIDWARSQNNLGNAYRERIEGERKQNIELSLQALQASLEVYTREAFPIDWARSQNNLGAAYSDRIEGERKQNIERAIQAYQASLEVRTREAFPVEWATTQNNLGVVYGDRIEGERKQNIERAIQACQASLEVYTREAFPADWAMTQNNLGAAYRERIEGERRENIERAIQAYQASLEVYTREAFPIDWAGVQNNLGIAYSDRIEGEHRENIERAIQAYQASLKVNQPKFLPLNCLQTGRNLGNLGFKEGDWQIAIEGFKKAITAVETCRSWAMSDHRRQEILDESIDIYEKMLQSCINANRLDLALQTVERVRSKRLVDLMAAPDLYPQGEIPEQVRLILEQIANIQRQMDNLKLGVQSSAPELAGATAARSRCRSTTNRRNSSSRSAKANPPQ